MGVVSPPRLAAAPGAGPSPDYPGHRLTSASCGLVRVSRTPAVGDSCGMGFIDEAVSAYMRRLCDRFDEPVLEEMEALGEERHFPIVGRVVGETGEVYLTDTDDANRASAEDFLTRAGVWGRCHFIVGDAVAALSAAEGEFDVVYNDIDKEGYPAAWQLARTRVGPGGLYLCDNVLWSGRVAAEGDESPQTRAIREHNEAVYADPDFTP